MLENTPTPAERNLVRLGEHQRLRETRMVFQYASVAEFCEPSRRPAALGSLTAALGQRGRHRRRVYRVVPVLKPSPEPRKVSDELERWMSGDGDKSLGGLIELFEHKSFAILFVLLLGVPALPLPTGGATHVFEVIAVLLALQLIVGRDEIWLPQRWRRLELAGGKQQRFLAALMKMIRRLERFSRPRLRFLFHGRLTNVVFGLLVIGGTVGAFFAPPFTGLDTLPALGVVLLSLAVLLEDILVAIVGLIVGAAGVVLEVVLGSAAINSLSGVF
jgi:hypothetical protein